MIGILVAILSGILMSVQGVFNTNVTKQASLWTTSAFVQFSALLVCLIAWLISDRQSFGAVMKVRPGYFLLGGVIGAFITYTVMVSMGQLGPAKAVMLIVTAQLIGAYLIEVLGLFQMEKHPVTLRELLGIAVTIGGIILFKIK